MKKRATFVSWMVSGALLSVGFTASGAETERVNLRGQNPKVDSTVLADGFGIEFAAAWTAVDWDAGDSFKDRTWGPDVALVYSLNSELSLRLKAKYFMSELDLGDEGTTDVSTLRIGLGLGYWFPVEMDLHPYVAAYLNHYLVDADAPWDAKDGMFGASAELGLSYPMNDQVALNLSAQAECGTAGSVAVTHANATTDDEDLSMSGLGFAVGVLCQF